MDCSNRRYGRDYYINDSKSASGSRHLRGSGNLNLHRTIDDEDGPNEYDTSDSVSDLDSFYSNRSETQCRYRYAHTPMTFRTANWHSPPSQLKRSHSLCSVRTYGLRKRFNLPVSAQGHLNEQPEPSHRPRAIIAQLERETLHGDIRRNSFSSRKGTNHFVTNPLYTESNMEL